MCLLLLTIILSGLKHGLLRNIDAPSSSLMDSTTSPKVKKVEGEGIRAHSLARNTLGVEGRVGVSGWD
jgi:hypothetical protein